MALEMSSQARANQPPGVSDAAVYQICVWGCLDDHWANWFEGMTLTRDAAHNTTTLTGAVPDQPALHGILAQIRDLGIILVSLRRMES